MSTYRAACPECERVFDLTDPDDSDEWYCGHDCEAPDPAPLSTAPRGSASERPDTISQLIAWENGALSPEETLGLFAQLIRTGLAWSLQGTYGRTARDLILGGYISEDGDVLGFPDYSDHHEVY